MNYRGAGWLLMLALVLFCGGCARQEVSGTALAQAREIGATLREEDQPQRQPKVAQADPTWFACQKSSDCEVMKGPCSEPQAVNRLFLADFTRYRNRMNQMTECAENARTVKTAPPRCLQNRCVLNPD